MIAGRRFVGTLIRVANVLHYALVGVCLAVIPVVIVHAEGLVVQVNSAANTENFNNSITLVCLLDVLGLSICNRITHQSVAL